MDWHLGAFSKKNQVELVHVLPPKKGEAVLAKIGSRFHLPVPKNEFLQGEFGKRCWEFSRWKGDVFFLNVFLICG